MCAPAVLGRRAGPSRPTRPCASWMVATPKCARPLTTCGSARRILVYTTLMVGTCGRGSAYSPAAPGRRGNCNSRPGIRNCEHDACAPDIRRDTQPAASRALRSGGPARQRERGGARGAPESAGRYAGRGAHRGCTRSAPHAAQLLRARAHRCRTRGGRAHRPGTADAARGPRDPACPRHGCGRRGCTPAAA